MARFLSLIDRVPVLLVLILCVALGLAPLWPEPHIWEKLKLLVAGVLVKPVDIFDLVLHGLPWVVLALKLARRARAG